MKKLALALVCFASLAFFASCVKEGQPTIQVLNAEGYVQDGATVNTGEQIDFGFVMASSAVTNSQLATLIVTVDGIGWDTIDLTGETEYTYRDYVEYQPEKDDILGTSVINAVVTDAAGQTATASITLTINQPATPLISQTIDWSRRGLTLESAAEMHAIGLDWPGNYRDEVFVKIVPMDGCSMYIINDGDEFNNITTQEEKAAYIENLVETATPATQYKEISAYHDGTYNTMLAVIDADGDYHLVRFTSATAELITAGALIHLYGEMK
jgi:hypothetical protein